MAIVGIELETLVSEPDALTTRPPPCTDLVCIVYIYVSIKSFINTVRLSGEI